MSSDTQSAQPVPPPSVPTDETAGFVEDQEEVLDEKPKSIILAMLKQVRLGMDLSRISLPTFVLEPRSITERFTDFMIHSYLLSEAVKEADPVNRMTKITSWLFAGWYPQSRGVKKPYNAVLGEYFRCFWEHPEDHSRTWYLAEQVSHHPPITAFRFENRQQGWYVDAHIFTKTKFLGNSVVCYLLGDIHLKLLRKKLAKEGADSSSQTDNTQNPNFNAPASMDDPEYEIEDYEILLPGVYGRGIIIGKLAVEVCDKLICTCLQTNLRSDLDFKAKPFFGSYNQVSGELYDLTEKGFKKDKKNGNIKTKEFGQGTTYIKFKGDWTTKLTCEDKRQTPIFGDGKTFTLWDKETAPQSKRFVMGLSQQQEYESRKIWGPVTAELKKRNTEGAGEQKHIIEERQRKQARDRLAQNIGWRQRFFHIDEQTGRWKFNYALPQELEAERKLLSNEMNILYGCDLDSPEAKEILKQKNSFIEEYLTNTEAVETQEDKELKAKLDGKIAESETEAAQSSSATEDAAASSSSSTDAPATPASTSAPATIITAFNVPDARTLLPHPPKGKHTEKGKDVDVWVTDFPPIPKVLGAPWPAAVSASTPQAQTAPAASSTEAPKEASLPAAASENKEEASQ